MTLQDFFISGLPTATDTKPRPAITQKSESSDNERNRLKPDQKSTRLTNAGPKTPTTSLSGMSSALPIVSFAFDSHLQRHHHMGLHHRIPMLK